MKTKTTITELTHEDLVNIISTATYESFYLSIAFDLNEYANLDESKKQGVSIEDRCADLLLAGKSISILDYYAEDEDDYYGKLPHEYKSVGSIQCMCYDVSLEDIIKGIEKCLDSDGYENQCARNISYNHGLDLDINEADTLIQMILFGEVIYS